MPDIPPHTRSDGPRGSAGANVAYLDQALWRQLADAGTAQEFCAAWLGLLCRMVGDVSCAVVVLGYGFLRGAWITGILGGLTLAMAVIPEEFPVILTVFMALGPGPTPWIAGPPPTRRPDGKSFASPFLLSDATDGDWPSDRIHRPPRVTA